MTDAISRSEVINVLQKLVDMETCGNTVSDIGFGLSMAIGRLISAPTLDVEPVVRCKDCKYFMPYTESYRKASGFDGACAILAGFTDCARECVHETDFCSRGARMDGEEHAVD